MKKLLFKFKMRRKHCLAYFCIRKRYPFTDRCEYHLKKEFIKGVKNEKV